MMSKISTLILVLALVVPAFAGAQATDEEFTGKIIVLDKPVHMVFQTQPRKTVGVNATESVSVTNSLNVTIPAGSVEIQFPSQLNVVATSPAAAAQVVTGEGQLLTWNVPALAPGQGFTVNFTVFPTQTALLVTTAARFFSPGNDAGFVVGGEAINAVGEVAGTITAVPEATGQDLGGTAAAEELPRTGLPLASLGVLIALAAVAARKYLPD